MSCCTTTKLLCSFLIFIFLVSSGAARRKRKQRRLKRSQDLACIKLEQQFQKAYIAQVDLIRRGLPTPVVQSEFTWAVNYFMFLNPSFRFKRLESTCVKKSVWNQVFDESSRAKFAIKYLQNIRHITAEITFLSFESYLKLPPMSGRERKLVQTMWQTAVVRLQKGKFSTLTKYKVSDFPFPQNIDVLYDPEQDQACQQYNKFRKVSSSKREADAKSALVALTLVSVNLYHRGGNLRSIEQMLKHFVGYTFTGIRCLRLEGPDIKIPREMLEAYSRNIAMIRSSVNRGNEDYRIKPEAVEHVFQDEIHSLLSYNSWGHLQYAILSPESSIPVLTNVVTKIFGKVQYKLLLLYSKSPSLLTSQKSPMDDKLPQNNKKLTALERKKNEVTCEEDYVWMAREEEVSDPLEHCCNEICFHWFQLMSGFIKYSAEACCSRCNQVNRCDSGVTQTDLSDNNYYSFFVPEYGEQDQIEMFLVAL